MVTQPVCSACKISTLSKHIPYGLNNVDVILINKTSHSNYFAETRFYMNFALRETALIILICIIWRYQICLKMSKLFLFFIIPVILVCVCKAFIKLHTEVTMHGYHRVDHGNNSQEIIIVKINSKCVSLLKVIALLIQIFTILISHYSDLLFTLCYL